MFVQFYTPYFYFLPKKSQDLDFKSENNWKQVCLKWIESIEQTGMFYMSVLNM